MRLADHKSILAAIELCLKIFFKYSVLAKLTSVTNLMVGVGQQHCCRPFLGENFFGENERKNGLMLSRMISKDDFCL
jgi:hypothetical protein